MTPVCSFICCSRDNPASLLRAIVSIYATAFNPASAEVLIRIDDDDKRTLEAMRDGLAQTFRELSPMIRVTVGKREKGYHSLKDFTIIEAAKSTGRWVCMWNDDAVFQPDTNAEPWDIQLDLFPETGVVVQPGIYKLNDSEYPLCAKSAFPFFPNNSWKQFGIAFWNDYEVAERLGGAGWKTHFLDGITVWHDRHESRLK